MSEPADGPSISGQQLNFVMDHCAISASVFHKLADKYRDKYMGLTMYDDSYREFCELLRQDRARVLDAECGPGNVSRYLMTQKPDLDLLGIDLAPRMVELAREAVPSAHFAVHDCRHLADLQLRFDGIICAFGLPYLSGEEATAFIRVGGQALDPGGVLYLSTMLGKTEDSGFQSCSTGDHTAPQNSAPEGAFLFAALACLLLLRHSTMGTANRPDSSSAAVVKTSPVVLFANATATTLGVDLEAAGFIVAHAESGVEAVVNTRKLLPDAILVSPDLPDMDGADVCERVRAELPSLTVPMIIVATDPPAAPTCVFGRYMLIEPTSVTATCWPLLNVRPFSSEIVYSSGKSVPRGSIQ